MSLGQQRRGSLQEIGELQENTSLFRHIQLQADHTLPMGLHRGYLPKLPGGHGIPIPDDFPGDGEVILQIHEIQLVFQG